MMISTLRSRPFTVSHCSGPLFRAVCVAGWRRLPRRPIARRNPRQSSVGRGAVEDRACQNVYVPDNRLHEAAHRGDISSVMHLIKSGTDLNARDWAGVHPLYRAASEGHMEVVEALLNAGADVNLLTRNCNTALWAAVVCDHPEIVNVLLQQEADPNVRMVNKVLLSSAIIAGNMDVIKSLLQHGAIVNTYIQGGSTPGCRHPLFTAACIGRLEVVELLLQKGADIDVVDDYGYTALDTALEQDHPEVAEFLRAAKAAKDASKNVDPLSTNCAEVTGRYSSDASPVSAPEAHGSPSRRQEGERRNAPSLEDDDLDWPEAITRRAEDLLYRENLRLQFQLEETTRERDSLRLLLRQQQQHNQQHD